MVRIEDKGRFPTLNKKTLTKAGDGVINGPTKDFLIVTGRLRGVNRIGSACENRNADPLSYQSFGPPNKKMTLPLDELIKRLDRIGYIVCPWSDHL